MCIRDRSRPAARRATGARLALCLPAGGTCALDLFAPPWLAARHVEIEALARGRSLGSWRLARGSRKTVSFEVARGCVELRLSPLFQPSARGLGDDERVLSCQCEGARFVDPAGVHDLLSPTLVPAIG